MGFHLGQTRRLAQLRKGDIININVPFEENTRDYYNGYKPEEIRQKPFVDRFGQSFKERMVIYIGRDGKNMLYVPLTSKTGAHDKPFQYQLKDNSMTPKRDVNRKSYVEVESMRSLKIAYGRDLAYTGRIAKEDLDNIKHRLTHSALQFNSKRDQWGYIPDQMTDLFEQELQHRGYQKTSESEDRTVWVKEETKQRISRTKYGMVQYHYPMTKEQVHALVSEREGHPLPPLPKSVPVNNTDKEKEDPFPQRPIRPPKEPTEPLAPFSDSIQKLSNEALQNKELDYST